MEMRRLELPDRSQSKMLLDDLVVRIPTVAPQLVDRPLVLYGAGKLGQLAAQLMDFLGIPIAYAIDRSPPANNLLLDRIPVYLPEEAPKKNHASHLVAVCVVVAPYTPIQSYLHTMGWLHVRPFYDVAEAYAGRVPLNNGWFAGALNTNDREQISRLLDAWYDDISRAAHLQFLAWRVHREEWLFSAAPVTIDNRYFIPEVLSALNSEECFLDAGAWRGTVCQRFLIESKGKFEQIVAIEADKDNACALRDWVKSLQPDQKNRIQIRECALSEEQGCFPFAHGYDLTSRLMPKAMGNVETFTLDYLNIPCSVAKIHLEGGELAALQGGLKTLKRYRPILAITVYHNCDGLWRTATWLMEHLSEYLFLFRMHAWCGTGAVIYAIPKERQV